LPKFEILKPDLFYGFLESLGKIGAQNKMPRVLNKMQAEMFNVGITFSSAIGDATNAIKDFPNAMKKMKDAVSSFADYLPKSLRGLTGRVEGK
jgi:hypothetical protein